MSQQPAPIANDAEPISFCSHCGCGECKNLDCIRPAPASVREFSTGAVRSLDAESTRYDLISPIGLQAVAETCAEGAAKYGDFNWEKGMPVHDLLNHAIRHVYCYLSGDRSEPHLPHAAWGLLAAIHSEASWPELNAGTLRGPKCGLPPESVMKTSKSV
jgi:hypothetical protein